MPDAPKCKHCGTELSGHEDPQETVRRAERGDLKGWCPEHDWQELDIREQQILAEVALKRIPPV